MRRLFTRVTLVCALSGALSVAALASGSASAASVPPHAYSSIQKENANCGRPLRSGALIGAAFFTRYGNEVELTYTLTAGVPETDYLVELYDGENCGELGVVTGVSTNRTGKGSATGYIEVPADVSRFFAAGFSLVNGFNDSFIVTLPGPKA